MVAIALIDWEGTYMEYPAHKCVSYGHVTDPLIATHQEYNIVIPGMATS